MEAKEIVIIVVAFGGWAFAALQSWLGYLERKQAKKEEYLFQALHWFEGKTQKRNIGISVVEGLWSELPKFRAILIPLLTNQAIYLLTQSHYQDALHERNNLIRIMNILINHPKFKTHNKNQYSELINAIEARLNREVKAGIELTKEQLENWKNTLQNK